VIRSLFSFAFFSLFWFVFFFSFGLLLSLFSLPFGSFFRLCSFVSLGVVLVFFSFRLALCFGFAPSFRLVSFLSFFLSAWLFVSALLSRFVRCCSCLFFFPLGSLFRLCSLASLGVALVFFFFRLALCFVFAPSLRSVSLSSFFPSVWLFVSVLLPRFARCRFRFFSFCFALFFGFAPSLRSVSLSSFFFLFGSLFCLCSFASLGVAFVSFSLLFVSLFWFCSLASLGVALVLFFLFGWLFVLFFCSFSLSLALAFIKKKEDAKRLLFLYDKWRSFIRVWLLFL